MSAILSADDRYLRRIIVQMEINDLAAIAAIRTRRHMTKRLIAMAELPRAVRRAKRRAANANKETPQ